MLVCLGGCASPPRQPANPLRHAAGDRVLTVRTAYGIPILQRSFFWDGNGEDDTASMRVRHLWYVDERLALGAGLAGGVFFESGSDAFFTEAEAVGRVQLYQGEGAGIFTELTGGWLQATRAAPAGGTDWNMTFSFGPGIEIPIAEHTTIETGVTYHHVSNALGRDNDRNPSQNEAQLWLGIGMQF